MAGVGQVSMISRIIRFWSRVKAPRSKEVDKICDINDQVIGDEESKGSWRDGRNTSLGRSAGRGQYKERCRTWSTQEEESISIGEVVETIAMLKSGKAPGICEIDVEMLKAARMYDDS